MSTEEKLSKLEHLKAGSHQLRGPIVEELQNDSDNFSGDAGQLLKHHGTYQQDNRDLRKAKNPDGTPKGKSYSCMVRTRIPGGKITADQFLAELDLCDRLGEGTVRITTRQGLQLHGVLKNNLKETIRTINDVKLSTYAACGDVGRNVMCCPAPFRSNPVRDQLQEHAAQVAEFMKPKSTAYYDIWLTDDDGEKTNVADFQPVEEPLYGERYLPRKFKIAFALPDDNCVDIYTHDLGFLAVVEDDKLIGFNVLVGGGMGRTPRAEKTFPAIGKRMAFVTPDRVLDITGAVVRVQRDFGNREDRKVARMKYLIANWGLEKFKAKVEEYYGENLDEPHSADVTEVDDHIGWHEQGDGKWFLGVNIENGRIKDEGSLRIKTGLRAIVEKYRPNVHFTALQAVLLCDLDADAKDDINQMLAEHGMKQDHELTLVRRYSIACPALPMCGLAVSDSERVMPDFIDRLEVAMAEQGMPDERIAVHMTGCPNACARPYTPDIGLVGKTLGKYTIFLGGNAQGTRLAYIYKDLVPFDDIVPTLSPVLGCYKEQRQDGESFGDFCNRIGKDALLSQTESA